MVNLAKQRRLAAQLLKVGEGRVWLDPEAPEKIAEAITREDVRGLIAEGVISAEQKKGISRGRTRWRAAQKAGGRRRGHGSRKGKMGARRGKKELWIKKVRVLRARLKELRAEGVIDKKTFRMIYIKVKGGNFRNVAHLNDYLMAQGFLPKESGQ